VGDYAAIEILANPTAKRFVGIGSGYAFNISSFSLQDNVKLVKFGYPCTYEKEDSRADQDLNLLSMRDDQYCGANNLRAVSGDWANTNCITEGSVAGGVANVGERSVNPLASDSTTYAPSSFFHKRTDRQHLVAYMKLPAVGEYDICVSTRMWRRTSYEMSRRSDSLWLAANAQPVWIKAYDASSSACDAIRGIRHDFGARCVVPTAALGVHGCSGDEPGYVDDDRRHAGDLGRDQVHDDVGHAQLRRGDSVGSQRRPRRTVTCSVWCQSLSSRRRRRRRRAS
jgi:hypothetical protein